jgi:hypothetical protein
MFFIEGVVVRSFVRSFVRFVHSFGRLVRSVRSYGVDMRDTNKVLGH